MKMETGLIACSDLSGYARFARTQEAPEVFRLLSDYYELVGDLISPAGGEAVKFMGDAVLYWFGETAADAGVRSLLELQRQGDAFLAARGASCRHHIRAHFDSVCRGKIGTRTEKRIDVLGPAVNTLFLLKASGFALTAEAFRQLAPETRRLFKKHTPPIAYIPHSQPHQD